MKLVLLTIVTMLPFTNTFAESLNDSSECSAKITKLNDLSSAFHSKDKSVLKTGTDVRNLILIPHLKNILISKGYQILDSNNKSKSSFKFSVNLRDESAIGWSDPRFEIVTYKKTSDSDSYLIINRTVDFPLGFESNTKILDIAIESIPNCSKARKLLESNNPKGCEVEVYSFKSTHWIKKDRRNGPRVLAETLHPIVIEDLQKKGYNVKTKLMNEEDFEKSTSKYKVVIDYTSYGWFSNSTPWFTIKMLKKSNHSSRHITVDNSLEFNATIDTKSLDIQDALIAIPQCSEAQLD